MLMRLEQGQGEFLPIPVLPVPAGLASEAARSGLLGTDLGIMEAQPEPSISCAQLSHHGPKLPFQTSLAALQG